jgi:hypothetical protein
MTKFFEKLIDKFFDFFNFGRFITIIIPGLLVALCFAMLASQLVFPASRTEKPIAPPEVANKERPIAPPEVANKERPITPPEAASQKMKSASDKGPVPTTPSQKEQALDAKKKSVSAPAGASQPLEAASAKAGKPPSSAVTAQSIKTPQEWFSAQVSQDFQRVRDGFYYVLIFTIILGLMLYEVGFGVILRQGVKTTEELHRYKNGDTYSTDGKILKRDFSFSTETDSVVGLVYFAPFLKEKFSGDENYFNFLVTEYYRFLEFSVVMPISIMISALVASVYYLLFGLRNFCWPHPVSVPAVLLAVFILALVFTCCVPSKVSGAYKKATSDLIKGVSDFMSKQLVKQ